MPSPASRPPGAGRAGAPGESWPNDAALLLAAGRAVDMGARILLAGRSHIDTLIGRGDRDFATNVDLQIESAIRSSLAATAPEVPILGEEQGGGETGGPQWVLDPIDGTLHWISPGWLPGGSTPP